MQQQLLWDCDWPKHAQAHICECIQEAPLHSAVSITPSDSRGKIACLGFSSTRSSSPAVCFRRRWLWQSHLSVWGAPDACRLCRAAVAEQRGC